MVATLIPVYADTRHIEPKSAHFSLEELQGYVGGYIELIRLNKVLLVVDEEGKLKGKPVNMRATALYRRYVKTSDYIVGDALLVPAELIQ